MKQKIFGFGFAVVLVAVTAGIWQLKPRWTKSKTMINIKEIQTSSKDVTGAPQDTIVFSDETTLREIGYDVVHVGTIMVSESHPVFLFKSYSCRACEPVVELWMYNAFDRSAERFVYPGQHFMTGTGGKSESEMLDHVAEGVFGPCGPDKEQMLAMAQKHREVESDGETLRAAQWTFTSTMVRFSPEGKSMVENTSEDSFEALHQRLEHVGCIEIEPEDRHDYL